MCASRPGTMTVEVAVLVDGANGIRTAVPRAIRCPTVEQYAAALVAGFARGNLLPRTGAARAMVSDQPDLHLEAMSLSDAELDRYARHIVLREIGGAGQVRLLASQCC